MASNDQEYEGPSDLTVRLGQASADGTAGGAVGAVLGTIVGWAMHNPPRTRELRQAIEAHSTIASSQRNSSAPVEAIETVRRVLGENRGFNRLWHVMDRSTKSIVSGIAGMILLSGLVQAASFLVRRKGAEAGRRQFEELQMRNGQLQRDLMERNIEVERLCSFADKVHGDREMKSIESRTR